jgi:hypothetical protein
MPQDTFQSFAFFLNSLDAEAEQKFELSHALAIICPDCGRNIAYRNRCPKCGGSSWMPAGHGGGIFEQQRRAIIRLEDNSESFRRREPAAQSDWSAEQR